MTQNKLRHAVLANYECLLINRGGSVQGYQFVNYTTARAIPALFWCFCMSVANRITTSALMQTPESQSSYGGCLLVTARWFTSLFGNLQSTIAPDEARGDSPLGITCLLTRLSTSRKAKSFSSQWKPHQRWWYSVHRSLAPLATPLRATRASLEPIVQHCVRSLSPHPR